MRSGSGISMLTFWPMASVRGVAEQPLGGVAEELHDAALVDHDHRIGNRLQDRAQMRLAGAQRFLDLLLLVDVEGDAAEVMRVAVLGADQARAQPDPVPRRAPGGD